ncbi:MAG TPA: hypothetical protein VGF55_07235 [Gemmataceae bacterium]|jgi:hypothetical protein
MRLVALALGTTVLSVAAAVAQPPPSPIITGPAPMDAHRGGAIKSSFDPPGRLPPAVTGSPAAPVQPPPPPQKFDTASLRLKLTGGQWQLWAGNLLLKDFGTAQADAYEALQVFRDLRVNARGSVGGVFEYWLADGQAPSAVARHRLVVPFEPTSLRAEQVSGQWVLRDARVILYNFGHSQAEALQALAVCRQYGFNQLGYVGHPTPVLKYLTKDPTPRPGTPIPEAVVPVSARMQEAEAAHARFVLPAAGDVGDRVPFDARRLDLRHEGGDWVLYAGRTPVGHFGPYERQGRAAVDALQQFRVTELCRVGDAGCGFFLSNGRVPQGSTIGTNARPLRAESLAVRQVGKAWAVCEGQRPVIEVGGSQDDANKVLAAIRELHCDNVIPVGNGRLGNVYLLVKTLY